MSSDRRRSVRVPGGPQWTAPKLPDPVIDPELTHPDVTTRTSGQERTTVLDGVDDGPRAIAYGEQRLNGKIQFAHYEAASVALAVFDRLIYVVELCAGECDALVSVTMPDGTPAPIGTNNVGFAPVAPFSLNVWFYPGTAVGELNARMQEYVPTWNELLPGTSYAVVELIGYSTTNWNSQVPSLRWLMRTRKPLCPDTGLHAYSTNVWDQWYDYALWAEGKKLPASRIDTASFAAAKAADIAAGRNMECHLLLQDFTDPDDVISTFRLIARAYWFIGSDGKYRVIADRPATAVATFDEQHATDPSPDLGRTDVVDRPNKVTIWHTDIENDWQLKPRSLSTAAVLAGLEDEVEEEYRLPHLHDPAIVDSLLTYLLNARQFDLRLTERWLASTAERQVGDIVARDIPSRGLLYTGRIIRRTRNPNNTFDVELLEHNDAKFAEFVVSDVPRIPSNLPSPSVAPPEVVGLTLTEEPYIDGGGNPQIRVRIDWTAPTSYRWYAFTRITVQANGGTPSVLAESGVGPVYITPAADLTHYDVSAEAVSTGGGVSAAATEAIDTSAARVPNPVTLVETITGGNATVYWEPPPVKSDDRFGAGMWSHSNMITFDAAKVNDGDRSTLAVTFPAYYDTTPGYLTLDLGAGNAKEFVELDVTLVPGGATATGLALEYSDDGSSWTFATFTRRYDFGYVPIISNQSIIRFVAEFSAGSHRYWRIQVTDTTGNRPEVAEVQFREWIAALYPHVAGYRIYSRDGKLLLEVSAVPTIAAPVTVTPWILRGGNWFYAPVIVKTVNVLGVESDGIEVTGIQNAGYATAVVESGAIMALTGKTISASANTISNLASTALTDSASLVRTVDGVAASVPTATPTSLFTATAGRTEVSAYLSNAGVIYLAFATVVHDGTNARIVANNGASLTLTLSGSDVQVTQSSGITTNVTWRYVKL